MQFKTRNTFLSLSCPFVWHVRLLTPYSRAIRNINGEKKNETKMCTNRLKIKKKKNEQIVEDISGKYWILCIQLFKLTGLA